MRRLYRDATVFVLASEREASPTVVQEAMSAGLAVVAADAGGTPEVVGDAGILVRPRDPAAIADALVRLAAEPELVRALGERARARVRDEFDWPRLARRYVELYAWYADRGGRRHGCARGRGREVEPAGVQVRRGGRGASLATGRRRGRARTGDRSAPSSESREPPG